MARTFRLWSRAPKRVRWTEKNNFQPKAVSGNTAFGWSVSTKPRLARNEFQLSKFPVSNPRLHLALYTGAREEELCQLTLDDIKTNAPIPYIKIIDLIDEKQDKQIKRLKNKGSRREIPIPKQLIAHGFLRYVEHLRKNSETWLFPKLTVEPKYGRRSANWCKWWGRWRKKLGVVGKEKCFHAFRHVFKTACRTAGIGEDIHDAITGHKEAHEGRNYGKFPLQALHGPLNKVAYPELNIDWVWQPSTPAPTRRRNPTKKSPVAPHAEPSAKSTKTAPRRRTPDFAQTGSTPSSADAPQRTPADD